MSQQLIEACRDNNKAKVVQLLESPSIVKRLNHVDGLLSRAVFWASADIVEALLRKGARVDVWTDVFRIKELPLHAACHVMCQIREDVIRTCELLLGDTNRHMNEPTVNTLDLFESIHRLPISIAAVGGNVELVDFFLHRGADYDIQGCDRGSGPLQSAASANKPKVIDLLLKHDPRIINTQSLYQKRDVLGTALHAAAVEGAVSAVKALVAHPDCDIMLKDSNGHTAKEVACIENEDDEKCFEVIIDILSKLENAK